MLLGQQEALVLELKERQAALGLALKEVLVLQESDLKAAQDPLVLLEITDRQGPRALVLKAVLEALVLQEPTEPTEQRDRLVLQGYKEQREPLARLEFLVAMDRLEPRVYQGLMARLGPQEPLASKVLQVRLVLLELKVPREQRELAQQELRGLLELQV